MKRYLPCLLALAVACAAVGCATQRTKTGRNTNVLGGLARVDSGSYQSAPATSLDVDTSDMVGRNNPSGTKVSLLWGLLTFTDN